MFENIVGNDLVKEYLQRIFEKKAIANSLLFAGPDGVGKSLFATKLAEALLGSADHPDLHVYHPEGKIGMHSIGSMRQFSEQVYLSPYSGERKVFIIHDADRMLTYSANALLKTFEEPSSDSIIILLSGSPSSLLSTILSRCRIIRFQGIDEEAIATFLVEKWGQDIVQARKLAEMSQGSIGQAVRLLQQGGDEIRNRVLQVLSKGKFSIYQDLMDFVEELTKLLEAGKKQVEEEIRKDILQGPKENFSAVQMQEIQKEIDGALAMRQMNDFQALLTVVLGWYRDLHLLDLNGNRKYLIHKDYAMDCEKALQKGGIIPIDSIQKHIADARLALERSTTLSIVLENLFLRILF